MGLFPALGYDLADDIIAGKEVGELVEARFVHVRRGEVVLHGNRNRLGIVKQPVVVQIEVDAHAGQTGFHAGAGRSGGGIEAEGVLPDVHQVGQVGLAVGPHQADVIVEVTRIEPDLGPLPAESVGPVDVAGGPLHVVIDKGHDVADRVVLDVERKRVQLVGIRPKVSHPDPVDLRVAVTVGSGSLGQMHRSGPSRVHVGPEGRDDRRGLRESVRGIGPQRLREGDIPVVIDVELRKIVAEELEIESEIELRSGLVIIGRHDNRTG